jgi:hypothetical protein
MNSRIGFALIARLELRFVAVVVLGRPTSQVRSYAVFDEFGFREAPPLVARF